MQDRPGWYADPSGGLDRFRWWDGGRWTRWLSRTAAAGAPPEAPAVAKPAAEAPVVADQPDGSASSAEPVAPGVPESDGTVKLPVAVAIALATLVLALIGVGAVASLSADKLPTGPALAPPTPTAPPPAVSFDQGSRRAALGELHFSAPGAPFTCAKPAEANPTFTSLLTCKAPVHPDYNTQGNSWGVLVGLGAYGSDEAPGADLESTAQTAYQAVLDRYYLPSEVRVTEQKIGKLRMIAPDGTAMLVTAEVHVEMKGLATSYDRVAVAVFRLQEGQYGVWFRLQPNDTPKATTKAMDASASTVRSVK